MTFRPLLLIAGLLLALALPSFAGAADSHAPKGARADWLPTDTWVMSSWLPFDQARLDQLLHTNRKELDRWLDDKRSLAQLAARRGHSNPRALAAALVAPRAKSVSRTQAARLRARALETLTQPHLANHVLFHIYHTPAIPRAARSIFGVSPARYRELRNRGWSPQRIGAANGRSVKHVRGALHALFVSRGDRAVRAGAMSRAQAKALLAQQDAGLQAYVQRRYRTTQQQVEFICRPH